MTQTRRQALALMGGTTAAALVPVSLLADSHAATEPQTIIVEMLSKDPADKKNTMIFNPPVVMANVGDTVKFVPTDKTHLCESDPKMIPAGGDEWKGKTNKEVEVTFTTEGTYGYFCKPHRSMGMVGLVLVGDPSANYEEARAVKQRGRAKKRYEEYFAMADEMIAEMKSS